MGRKTEEYQFCIWISEEMIHDLNVCTVKNDCNNCSCRIGKNGCLKEHLVSANGKKLTHDYDVMKELRRLGILEGGKRTDEQLAQRIGTSRNTLQRYKRLYDGNLIAELLTGIDCKKIPAMAGYELSFIEKKEQESIAQIWEKTNLKITIKAAKALRSLSKETQLTDKAIIEALENG